MVVLGILAQLAITSGKAVLAKAKGTVVRRGTRDA
jgi:hypothetical protein